MFVSFEPLLHAAKTCFSTYLVLPLTLATCWLRSFTPKLGSDVAVLMRPLDADRLQMLEAYADM